MSSSPDLPAAARRACLLTALAIYDVVYLAQCLSRPDGRHFNDFFGLWSFGRFAAQAGAAVYDPFRLAGFQHGLLPQLMGSGGYPCPYPPPFLLALTVLALFPLPLAYVVWMGATFCGYCVALLGRDWRSRWGFALLAAPTTLLNVVAGQNGFLTAALLVGGLKCLRRFPIVSGLLFGLLTYKFQFGILIPVVLIATRSVKVTLSACATTLALCLASTLAFGPSVWLVWTKSLSIYSHLLQHNLSGLYHAMPTFTASLLAVGAPLWLAVAVQIPAFLAVAFAVWRAAALAWDDRTVALVLVGAAIVTPYAFTYDMPILAAGVMLEARHRLRRGEAISIYELAPVLLLAAMLLAMSASVIPFAAPILIAVIFATIAMAPGRSAARTSPMQTAPLTSASGVR